jgi:hypothetical protein
MKEADRVIADLSRVSDASYLAKDEAVAESLPRNAMAYGFEGIALGAPRSIAAGASGVPALLLSSESAGRSADVPLHRNAIAVAIDLDRGTILADEAFPMDPSKSPEEPPGAEPAPASEPPAQDPETAKALEELGDGRAAGAAWLDFEGLLGIPRRSSRLALRVVSFDRITNAPEVRLEGPEEEMAGPPAATAAEIATGGAAAGRSFGRAAATPSLPGEGVALALVAGADGAAPGAAHGALKIALPRASIVTASAEAGGARPPSAVLKALLLIAKKGSTHASRIEIDVPVWATGAKAGEVVEADFSLDLTKEIRPPLPAGSYCAWLLAGPHASAPQRFDVSRER